MWCFEINLMMHVTMPGATYNIQRNTRGFARRNKFQRTYSTEQVRWHHRITVIHWYNRWHIFIIKRVQNALRYLFALELYQPNRIHK